MKRRSRNTEETFTLFPFLAVLLCTMGALTLIFALVAQHSTNDDSEIASNATDEAQESVMYFDETAALGSEPTGRIIDAETLSAASGERRSDSFSQFDSLAELPDESDAAQPTDAEEPDAYELALVQTGAAPLWDVLHENETLEWMLGELEMAKDVADSMIEDERARLANAEVGLANLRAEMEATREKYALLEERNATDANDLAARQAQVASLDKEIAALQSETEGLRARNANAKKSYAIIPYQGKKGTFRRPIYVECNGRGCAIQPENVLFTEEDLLLAKYPGNPFDAALRAVAQRYLVEDGATTAIGNAVEPYPLLIVRPSGSEYFYAATAALASWGGVFGYEFVEEDQEIAYPAADPQTAKLATDQANYARNRLAMQLQALLASSESRGGLGGGAPWSESGMANASALSARLGTGVRLGAAATPQLIAGNGVGAGAGGSGGVSSGARLREGRYSGVLKEYGTAPDAPIVGETLELPQYVGKYAKQANGANASFGQGGQGQGGQAPTEPGVGTASALEGATSIASAPEAGGASPSNANGLPTQGGAAPEYMKNFMASREPASGESSVDYEKTLGNTTFKENSTGKPSTQVGAETQARETPEKPDPRAENPEGAFSVTEELARPATSGNERGVRAICLADRYVFPRQPGFRSDTTIPRVGKTPQEVEKALEDAIALCVRSWGAAGRNHYWAPFLRVEVRDGGEESFRALDEFCRRQGLGIARVQSGAVAQ